MVTLLVFCNECIMFSWKHSESNHAHKGTHSIQSIEVAAGSTWPEMLNISCHYDTRRTTATGCFVVALHWNMDTSPLYVAVYKSQPVEDTLVTRFTVNELTTRKMWFYEIENNLLPGRFPSFTEILYDDDNTSSTEGMDLNILNQSKGLFLCFSYYLQALRIQTIPSWKYQPLNQ